MSQHTYTSCYKVTVPPIDFEHASRRTGVRLQEGCLPLSELANFTELYLPKQRHSEFVESEAARLGHAITHPPGWKETVQSGLHEELARLRLSQQKYAGDIALNGTQIMKGRYALRHEFDALKSADGTTVFAVKYQRGAHQARRGKVDRAVNGETADESERRGREQFDGIPYWLRMEPVGGTVPRSTTQATYRGIPEESFLLDRKHFHSSIEMLPPATPALDSTGRVRPVSARSQEYVSSVKHIPSCSSEQPCLIFRIPERAAHPEMWRKSKTLRGEMNQRRNLASSDRRRNIMQPLEASSPTNTILTPQPQPPQSARSTRPFPIHPASNSRIPLTARERPTKPMYEREEKTNGEDGLGPSQTTSRFQQHMQQARQRWREQGLIAE
jgi:hypothetical protein